MTRPREAILRELAESGATLAAIERTREEMQARMQALRGELAMSQLSNTMTRRSVTSTEKCDFPAPETAPCVDPDTRIFNLLVDAIRGVTTNRPFLLVN
jgi:hypothetical protein